MVQHTASVFVNRSPEEAFDIIAQMAATMWQTSSITSENLSGGPLAVGTRFKETFHVLGDALQAECVVTGLERGRLLAWKGAAPGLDYEGEWRFTPEGEGFRLTYNAASTLGEQYAGRADEYARQWDEKNAEELQQIKAMLEGQGEAMEH